MSGNNTDDNIFGNFSNFFNIEKKSNNNNDGSGTEDDECDR